MAVKIAMIAGVIVALTALSSHATDITGAGSTFAAPLYSMWAEAYQKTGAGQVNYQGIGSSGGTRQIVAGTLDFAGSDIPLTDEELAKNGLFQFPTVVGGVVATVNLRGIGPGQLTLSGPALGDIYLGKITKWNDPAIAALNPMLKLPAIDIAVVRRVDGSGTTFIWTDYLSKVNPEWRSKVGEGATVSWPVGAGGKGNDGVAEFVQRIEGAIGYVEWAYAKQNHMAYTDMVNAAGAVVEPGAGTFKAAAEAAQWQKTFDPILTDEPGQLAWPVVGGTFVLLHTKQISAKKGMATLRFFDWAFANGEPMADALDYVWLPKSVVSTIREQWRAKIKDASGTAVFD